MGLATFLNALSKSFESLLAPISSPISRKRLYCSGSEVFLGLGDLRGMSSVTGLVADKPALTTAMSRKVALIQIACRAGWLRARRAPRTAQDHDGNYESRLHDRASSCGVEGLIS